MITALQIALLIFCCIFYMASFDKNSGYKFLIAGASTTVLLMLSIMLGYSRG